MALKARVWKVRPVMDPGDVLDPEDRAALHLALAASQEDVEAGRLLEPEEVLGRREEYHGPMRRIEARYEEGLLKPETPLALKPGEKVTLIVTRHADRRRWNLERLGSGAEEDQTLAEQGLSEWADLLDKEDDL